MSASTAQASLSFIHATLDDAKLAPTVFRCYCHVIRRSGQRGFFDESSPNAARHCGVNVKTWRKSMEILAARGMLVEEQRPGATTIFRPTDPDTWQPYPKGYPGIGLGKVSKRVGTLPKRIPGNPTQTNTHKVTPSEVTPFKLRPKRGVEI